MRTVLVYLYQSAHNCDLTEKVWYQNNINNHCVTREMSVFVGREKGQHMRKTAYAKEMERTYGRAWRFVNRALTAYRNMIGFRTPTPNQCIYRLLDHMERVQSLGDKVITQQQRKRAQEAIWELIAKAQDYDAGCSGPDRSEETAYGDAESVLKAQGWAEAGMEGRHRLHDSGDDPTLRHARPEMVDERVHYSDPAVHLAGYRIRASERLQTILPPSYEDRFALIHPSPFTAQLERVDRSLARQQARRKRPESCPA